MKILGYTTSNSSAAIITATKTYAIDSSHPHFDDIVNALLSSDCHYDTSGGSYFDVPIDDIIDIPAAIQKVAPDGLHIDPDTYSATYNGTPINGTLLDFLLRLFQSGANLAPWGRFVASVMRNPSYRSREQLFDFMQANSISINTEGELLLYKKVRHDYLDVYSGTLRNQVGDIVMMDRPNVDDDPNRTCSSGLHVAAHSYIPSYGGDRVMICAVRPEDVVSIPTDYNNAKMRCCRYRVVAEHPGAMTAPTLNNPIYDDADLEDFGDEVDAYNHLDEQ